MYPGIQAIKLESVFLLIICFMSVRSLAQPEELWRLEKYVFSPPLLKRQSSWDNTSKRNCLRRRWVLAEVRGWIRGGNAPKRSPQSGVDVNRRHTTVTFLPAHTSPAQAHRGCWLIRWLLALLNCSLWGRDTPHELPDHWYPGRTGLFWPLYQQLPTQLKSELHGRRWKKKGLSSSPVLTLWHGQHFPGGSYWRFWWFSGRPQSSMSWNGLPHPPPHSAASTSGKPESYALLYLTELLLCASLPKNQRTTQLTIGETFSQVRALPQPEVEQPWQEAHRMERKQAER